jgi:acetyl esterase
VAQYICFERQIHGFITMGRVIREAYTAVDVCGQALRRYLSPNGLGR